MICLADGLAVVFLGEPQKASSLECATKTLTEGRDWKDESRRSSEVVLSSLCTLRSRWGFKESVDHSTTQHDQRNVFMLVRLLW